MKYNKENILTYLNQKAFSDDEYTKDEYMKELLKLQDAILDLYRVEGKFTDENVKDLTYILQHRAWEEGLKDNEIIKEGINELKYLEKLISIECSGKKAENIVSDVVNQNKKQYVTCYRNVNLKSGKDETEVDQIILTPEGIMILEVKGVRDNVTIGGDGRIFSGGLSHDQNPTGSQMKLQRELLKVAINRELRNMKISITPYIESTLILVAPHQIKMNNNYGKEKVAFPCNVPDIINYYEEHRVYDENELAVLDKVLSSLEKKEKRYKRSREINPIKNSIAALVELMPPKENNEVIQKTGFMERFNEITLEDVKGVLPKIGLALSGIGMAVFAGCAGYYGYKAANIKSYKF